MKQIFRIAMVCLAAAASTVLAGAIETETFDYAHEDVALEGYLAKPQKINEPVPAVLVFHQWGGPSELEFDRARRLAELGYVALAADVYGKGYRPETTEERAALSGAYKQNRELFRERVLAALDAVRALPYVNADKVTAVGYCFGGTAVLELARAGATVKGVVSTHGGLSSPTPEDAENITAKVLVLHGADDPYVPPAEVEAFKKEMEDAGVDYTFIAYPGAVHSFSDKDAGTDPSTGAAYNPEVDAMAWQETLDFIADTTGHAARQYDRPDE